MHLSYPGYISHSKPIVLVMSEVREKEKYRSRKKVISPSELGRLKNYINILEVGNDFSL